MSLGHEVDGLIINRNVDDLLDFEEYSMKIGHTGISKPIKSFEITRLLCHIN
jgi:hypothetical protein